MTSLAPAPPADAARAAARHPASPGAHPTAGIPFARLLGLELRKMFDTRSGFWLMASIVILAVLASAGVILFAPDPEIRYGNFAAAIGFPMAVVLPIIAALSVTGEWSQRSGLTTFTLVPHRGRVIAAKAAAAVLVGVVSMGLAFAIGAVGNLLGIAVTGVEPVWDDMPPRVMATIVLGNVLGLLIGFMLGVLLRSSAGAVVAYFVYAFVLPTIAEVLAATQQWFADVRGWVDVNYAMAPLFEDATIRAEQWAQLGVTSAAWIALPLAIGLVLVMRSEVK